MKGVLKRIIAMLLSVVMVVSNCQFSAFAGDGVASYSNYLDGWNVDVAWNNLSYDYDWTAENESIQQPKMIITYRMDNAERDYPAGSLTFTVPGIGNINRNKVMKAYKLAADETDSEWNYTWDQVNDLYTFTNKFTVKIGQSVSGGFELLWNLDARNCSDGFERTESPTFSVSDKGAIILNPLSFSFHSTRDRYRISLTRNKLTPEDYETSDKTMIWYRFDTLFNSDYLARGLYKSDYYMSIELPDGVEDSDVAAKVSGKTVKLTRNENGDFGFYPFKDKYGDIANMNSTHIENVEIGFTKKTLDGKNVTVSGHFDRLYNDEEEYVRTAGENENVDVSTTFTISGYKFNSKGYIYSLYKYSKFEHGYLNWLKHNKLLYTNDSAEPDEYQDRFPATGLFNGKIVEFTLGGKARRNYGSAVAASLSRRAKARALNDSENNNDDVESITDDASLSDWDDLNWKENGLLSNSEELDGATYGELYPNSISMEDYESMKGEDPEDAEDADIEEDVDTDTEESLPDNEKKATESDAEREDDAEAEESADALSIKRFHPVSILQNAFFMKAFASENEDAAYIEKATDSNIQKNENVTLNDANSDAEEDTYDTSLADLSGGKPKKATRPGGNDTGISNVKEDQEYSLVLGDDKLAVALNNGSMRALQDEEYDISYVYVPSTYPSYDYEIFGADTQDTHFDDYHLLASGKTDNGETVTLPEGVKAVFVRVNGIVGSYALDNVRVGVRFHLDWDEEREKEVGEQVNRDGKVANFSYFRALYTDDDGYEVNDCAMHASNYEDDYGTELAERDINTYKEYLFREYANVWLRNPTTVLNSSASISSMSGTAKEGYTATLKASGNIHGDNSGALQSFSLYMEVPAGMNVDLDETGASVTGSGTILDGAETDDFQSHATISKRDNNGKHYIVADFDFSDEPLDTAELTSVSMTVPATLSYADFVSNGSYYRTGSYIMPHDGGLDKISGSQITEDTYDLDENGSTEDFMAYAYDFSIVQDDATEWREYVSKYVKSSYSNGFTNDTVTRLYSSTDTAEDKKKSDYQYRLDFGLGSSNAKNIVFFDNIEQGAEIALSGDNKDTKKTVKSEWQGTFQSVDTTYAEKLGLIPTIYYSTNKDQQQDLSASGWTTEKPSDLSAVKNIAVLLDTSKMPDGIMKTKQMAYIILNMRAPSDRNLVEKKAVNQYTVQYDAYGITNKFEKTYTLSSSETYVTLLDNVGKIVLQKVDGDNVLSVDSNGAKKYATLTGAVIQVYDPDGKALFDKDGKEVNSLGRIVISNVRTGKYSWEELKAPTGYQKVTGKHTFTVDSINEITNVENKRIPGSVTLTKYDHDDPEHAALSGAEYALYKSDGTRVAIAKAGSSYSYVETGKDSTCVTGKNGTLTVSGLPWGSYYFLEVNAPKGYEINTEKITFELGKKQYDSKTNTIYTSVKQNDEEKTTSIRLTKMDATSKKLLKNAYYNLSVLQKDGTYKNVEENVKTNTAGEFTVEGLKFGHYKITEAMPPEGYKLNKNAIEVDLNESTVETVISVSQTDERKSGSVKLMKDSVDGIPLANAVFDFYKVDTSSDVLLKKGCITGSDGCTPVIENLSWGDYYFIETSAPSGYQKSDEKISVSVNAENVGAVQTIKTSNNRILGSVTLTKLDEATKSKKLSGAEFSLFKNDGTLVKSGLTTGTDGTVTTQALDWGSYYFEETKAPNGYGVSNAKVRFSVNADNCNVLQSVLCYDPVEQAEIKINKSINESYAPFGNATFIFKIKGTDINGVNHTWTRTITMKDGELEGSTRLTGIPVGKYTIEEQSVSRYGLSKLQAVKNVTINGNTATADLTSEKEAEVTFKNDISQYEKFSHTTNTVNIVSKGIMPTGLRVKYTGPSTISSDTDTSYRFTENDITAIVIYDDGTTASAPFSKLTIDPSEITGNNNTSGAGYTIHVSYTENGATVTDTFNVNVKLQIPTRFTVTYNANGGYFGDDTSNTLNQVTYEWHNDHLVVVEGEEKEPNYLNRYFDKWYTDTFYTTVFSPENCTENTTVYAVTKTQIISNLQAAIYSNIDYKKLTGFVRSEQMPSAEMQKNENGVTHVISTDDSTFPVYLWADGSVLKWWSKADTVLAPASMDVFSGCSLLEDISGLYDFDTSNVTSMYYLFANCYKLHDISALATWNVSNVKTFSFMFNDTNYYGTEADTFSLEPLSKWDVSNATDFSDMFSNVRGLKSVNGIEHWKFGNGVKLGYMFDYCPDLSDISNLDWEIGSNADVHYVFKLSGSTHVNISNCSIKIGNESIISAVFSDGIYDSISDLSISIGDNAKNIYNIVYPSSSGNGLITEVNNVSFNIGSNNKIGSLMYNIYPKSMDNISVTIGDNDEITNYLFYLNDSPDFVIPNMNVTIGNNVSGSYGLFNYGFNSISFGNLTITMGDNTSVNLLLANIGISDVSSIHLTSGINTSFIGAFRCKKLTSLNGIEKWNIGSIVNMKSMFSGCNTLTDISQLANLDTSEVTNMSLMFSGCRSLTDLNPLADWDTGNVTDMSEMFSNCRNLTSLSSLDWDTSNVTNMFSMFNGCSSLTDLNGLSNWNTGNVTDLRNAFYNCSSLTDLSPLANWDTSNVEYIEMMFRYCSSLVTIPTLNWDLKNVDNCEYPYGIGNMFQSCKNLKSIDGLVGWKNTGHITNANDAFSQCENLENIEGFKNFDASSLTRTEDMFSQCPKLTNLRGLENWNTKSLKNAYRMFYMCKNLNDLSALAKWNTSSLNDSGKMFKETGITNLKGLENWDVRSVNSMYEMFESCKNLTDATAINNWNPKYFMDNNKEIDSIFYGCADSIIYPTWNGTWNRGTFKPAA